MCTRAQALGTAEALTSISLSYPLGACRPAPSTGAGSGGASEYDLAAAQLYMNQAALGIGLGLLPPGVMPFIPAPGR
jgi:hypothetical protein